MEYQAVSEFTRRVSELFSGNFVRAALFGSKARGESHPESDLDVAVVMRSVDSAIKMGIFDIAAEELLRYEVDISPLVFAADRYEQMKSEGYSIISEIERDQIEL
jgi:predicted nucleotidyltransferase